MNKLTLPLITSLGVLISCTYVSQGVFVDHERYAKTSQNDIFGDNTDKVVYLDQNWDRYDSLWFYNTTQGSNFMPYEVFLHLTQADNKQLFRHADNISQYRFLNQRKSYDNPDGLPVGFVEDTYQGKRYMGFTCAACHTTQINYQKIGIRIDGAPALADFESFFIDITAAIKATLDSPTKFDQLAKKMVDEGIAKDKKDFRQQLKAIYQERVYYDTSNTPTYDDQTVHYGYGRLDAFGRIFNRVLKHLNPDDPNQFNPANAPVSYPSLWDTPQHDFVQWNGIANNNSGAEKGFLGPLMRNTGEALGVFATFGLDKHMGDKGYRSSVVRRNLLRLEDHLITLESPAWPENILPKIDQTLAKQGKKIYQTYQCYECHSDPEHFDKRSSARRVIAQFSSLSLIRTDPSMAVNALTSQGSSGFFKGKEIPDIPGGKFKETTNVFFALKKSTIGIVAEADHDKPAPQRWAEQAYDFVVAKANNPVAATTRHVDFETGTSFPDSLKVYKARPLNGIWATAPFLHNGSVPNLYELFLPSCSEEDVSPEKECRSNTFTLGSREFDPVKVGFVSKSITSYPRLFEFNALLPSNKNIGHEYAAGKTPFIKLKPNGVPIKNEAGEFELEWLPALNKNQRLALVEYLKTL